MSANLTRGTSQKISDLIKKWKNAKMLTIKEKLIVTAGGILALVAVTLIGAHLAPSVVKIWNWANCSTYEVNGDTIESGTCGK